MPRPSLRGLVLPLLLLLPLGGCVRQSTYDEAQADLARERQGREALREEMERRLQECEEEAAAAAREHEAARSELRERIGSLEGEVRRLETRSTRAEARFEEAREEVHRLEVILNERGSEYRRLQQRLESLRAIEREVRQRNAIYEDVLARFRSLIDGGRLTVSIDRGRMVIQLPQDVLFQSGSARLAADGRSTLEEVGSVLAELGDRRFQVEGHTDDVPISTERFPSNWELSTARALSVVRLLVERGVPPENLSGAGYGEHQPVASNDDAEGRRRNRRIEIVMQPNLDVIAGTRIPD